LKPRVAIVRRYPHAAGKINPVLRRERLRLRDCIRITARSAVAALLDSTGRREERQQRLTINREFDGGAP
jgi:hypothetical protein